MKSDLLDKDRLIRDLELRLNAQKVGTSVRDYGVIGQTPEKYVEPCKHIFMDLWWIPLTVCYDIALD